MAIGSVGVNVVPDAEGFWRRFEAQTRGGATETGRKAGRDIRIAAESELSARPIKVRAEADTAVARAQLAALRSEGNRTGGGLLKVLLPLAPALAPLAGAAGAATAAFGFMGAAGILAITGLNKQLKEVTPRGLEVDTVVRNLKSSVSQLQSTAAAGALPGFEQAIGKLRQELPLLNDDIRTQAQLLGETTSHLAGGLVGGLHTFQPILTAIDTSIANVAAHFEQWATGPGGEKFAQTLLQDYRGVAPVIDDVGHAITKILSASNDTGLGIVSLIDDLARAVDAFPQPALEAIIAGFVTFKAIGLASTAIVAVQGAIAKLGTTSGNVAAIFTVNQLQMQAAAAESAAAIAASSAAAAESQLAEAQEARAAYAQIAAARGDLAFEQNAFVQVQMAAADRMIATYAAEAVAATAAADTTAAAAAEAAAASETAGAAASAGWASILGPVGLVAGGLLLLTGAFSSDSDAARENTSTIQSYTQALVQANGAINDSVRAQAAKKLSDDGLLTSAKAFGISQSDITSAVLQGGSALNKVNAVLGQHSTALSRSVADIAELTGIYDKNSLTADELSDAIAHQRDLFVQAQRAARDQQAALAGAAAGNDVLSQAIADGDTALRGWVDAAGAFRQSADTVADRGKLIGEALRASNGDMLSFAQTMVGTATANQQFVTDLKNVKDGVIDLKTGTIDYHNAAAGPLINDLQGIQDANVKAAAAIYQHELAQKGSKKASDDAFAAYRTNTRLALIDEAEKLGYTATQAKGLADQFLTIHNAKDLKKHIELLGGDKVEAALKGILEDLDILAGKRTLLSIDIVKRNREIGPPTGTPGKNYPQAAGTGATFGQSTIPPNTRFTVGERGWEGGVTDSAGRTAIFSHSQSIAMGFQAPTGYAGGSGETGGFSDVDYSGNANKYGKVKGSSSASNAFGRDTLSQFLQAVTGIQQSPIVSALNAILQSARDAKHPLPSKLIATLRSENRQLIGLVHDRDHVAAQLEKAQQKLADAQSTYHNEIKTVSSAVTATFDIAQVRSVYNDRKVGISDILTQVKTAVTNASRFTSVMRKLVKEGLSPALVQQLAEAGPAALPQAEALLSATPAQFAEVNAQYKKLSAAGSYLGKFIGDDLYKAGVDSAKGLVAGLKSQEHELTAEMKHLADTMIAEIKKRLGIKSPSTVMHGLGRHTTRGYADGVVSQLPAVKDAANRMAQAVQFRPDALQTGTTAVGADGQRHYHVHGIDDPAAFTSAVIRREAFLAGA